jgi:phage-related tail protein
MPGSKRTAADVYSKQLKDMATATAAAAAVDSLLAHTTQVSRHSNIQQPLTESF